MFITYPPPLKTHSSLLTPPPHSYLSILGPLTPKGLISPCNIPPESQIEVTRTKKMNTN